MYVSSSFAACDTYSMQGLRRRAPSTAEMMDILHSWLGEDPRKIFQASKPATVPPKAAVPTPATAKPPQNGKAAVTSLPKAESNWADEVEEEVDDDTLTNIQQERMVGDEDVGTGGEPILEFRGALVN